MYFLLTSVVLVNAVFGHNFSFPEPVEQHPATSCGLQNLQGHWTVQGRVKLSCHEFFTHDPTVLIKTTHEICSIDLTRCINKTNAPTTIDACYCSKEHNGEFNLYVRQRSRTSESGLMLQAEIPTRNNGEVVSIEIGNLPHVYDAASATYKVDDTVTKTLLPVQDITVHENVFVTLKFCVTSLLPDSVIKVNVGRQDITTTDMCIQFTKKYDFGSDDVHTVTVYYHERAGCARSGTFSVNLREYKGGPVAVVKKTCMGESPYLPLTLPNGTCAADETSCPLEIVTLSNGQMLACDTQTLGGGWFFIQRRSSADVDFQRNWKEYQEGFGDLEGNFWFGLDNIYRLCQKMSCQLRVNIVYQNVSYYANYDNFSISGPGDDFRLSISGYSGSAADAIGQYNINGMKFTTKDKDNDVWSRNCAIHQQSGGWWYSNCAYSNLNGVWGSKVVWKGPLWYPTTKNTEPVSYSAMMVRPHRSV